jgi:hypothetical protein
MNNSLCKEFIRYLDRDDSLNCGHAPEHIQNWLEEIGLPMNLLRFMQWNWPQANCLLAHIDIQSSESIYADDSTYHLLKHKFMNAGSAPNGDWFVIDFVTDACRPGFITHEEWSPRSAEPQDPREYYQPIARTFDSFLYRVVEGLYLPTDFYAARDFNAFLEEER